MGCWDGTCELSRLPIVFNDDIILITLVSNAEISVGDGLFCSADDKYTVFGCPLIGSYDDYGFIDADLSSQLEFLNAHDIYTLEDGNYVKVDKFDEEAYRDLCTKNMDYFVKYEDGYRLLNMMMVHLPLYNDLIAEMKRRTSLGQLVLRIKDYKEVNDISSSLMLTISNGGIDSLTYDYVLHKYYETRDENYITMLLDMLYFKRALSGLRSGYLVTSGLGSQAREMKLQRILAKFIYVYTENYLADLEEYADDRVTEEDLVS